MGDRIEPGALPAGEEARTEAWLGGLLTRGLCLPEGLTIEQRDRERTGARAAAAELAGELEGEGAGIAERALAAQFVCAHAAAMDRQAEANRRDLPDHARQTSQRLARQLMALTASQVHALCRLRAERRKEREQAAKLAEREAAHRIKARAADTRAMITGFEQTLKDLARAERAAPRAARDGGFEAELDGDFAGDFEDGFAEGLGEGTCGAVPDTAPSEPSAASPAQPAKPEAVSAGVPKPPDGPAPPLNRRQRRALKRLRRKERGEGMR
jgi:hypothetical protein